MKLPGIFTLTKPERRAVILIMMALLAAAAAKRYRDEHIRVISPKPAQAHVIPSATPSETEVAESDSP
jgi:hypothetical protein